MKQTLNIFVFLLGSQAIFAQNIDNILSSVAKNNKTLIANAQFFEARKLEYKTGITPEDPKIEYDYLVGSPAGAGNQTDFSVTQSLDFPTAYFSKKAMANQQIAKTELQKTALRQDVMLETKNTCFTLIYLNKKQAELSRRMKSASLLYEAYKAKAGLGEATVLDVNKARLLLLGLKTELAMNESEIKRSMSVLTDLNGGIAVTLTDTVYPITQVLPSFTRIDSLIETNDMLVKLYNKDKDVSTAKLKVAKSMAFPKIEVGYHSQAILGQKYQGAHLGMSIPLWQNKNTVKTEKANIAFADLRITEHRTEHFYENQQLYETYLVLKSTLSEYDAIFKSSNTAELLSKSLKGGNISSIEYFMELTYFYSAYDNYLRAENDYNKTIAALYKYQL